MDPEELIHINVIIADRPYPLKIKQEEEEGIRKAAKFVNEKVKEFTNNYAAKDKQDYLAMCSLMLAVEALKIEDKVVIEDSSILDQLHKLSHQMDEALKKA
jgi:cell division protein ZapA